MKRLFFLILSFFIFNSSFLSYGMSPENLDDYVHTCLRQSSQPEFNTAILPSRIRGNINITNNLRFFAELGPLLNQKYPPYSQCAGLRDFPQTPLTLLLQIFFPSPDDTTLTPNQSSDPVASLTSVQLGQLLILTENYLLTPGDSNKDLSFKLNVYQLLNPKKPLNEESYKSYLREHYPSLLLHEFKMIFASSLEKALPLMLDDFQLKSLGDFPLTSLLKMHTPFCLEKDLFSQEILKDNELESYQSARRAASETELSISLRLLKSEKEGTKFKSFRFSEVLLDALKEQITPEKPLPSSVIQRLIFSFFWKKFKPTDSNDFLVQFLSGYADISVETLKKIKLPKTHLSKEDYWHIRNDPDTLQRYLSDIPMSAYLSQGYLDYEEPIPSFVGYYKTRYNGSVKFSDCCEIAILNALRAGLKSSSHPSTLVQTKYLFSEDNPLRQILEGDIRDDDFSQEERSNWAARCANLLNVRYLKSSQGKGHPHDCEISPGLINALNVIRGILNDPLYTNPLPYDPSEEILSEEINRLCALFSQKGSLFTWSKKELQFNSPKNDWFGAIVFHINGAEAFELVMDLGAPGHGYTKRYPSLRDWRKMTPFPNAAPPEILGIFSAPYHFKSTLPSFSRQDQITFAHSLDLTTWVDQKELIKSAYTDYPDLIPFAQNLILSIFNREELSSNRVLLETLISLAEHPLLTEIMRQAFKYHPDLLELDLEYPFNVSQRNPEFPSTHMLLILLQENKMIWVEPLFPSLHSLSLNPIGPKIEPLLEFFQTGVPQFSSLQTFYYNNLNRLRDEVTTNAELSALLPTFKSLNDFSILNLCDVPLASLRKVIEALPPSLTEFSMVFMEGHTHTLVGETQVPLFQEEKWQEIIPYLTLFFTNHPNAKFILTTARDFSNTDQERVKTIFTDSGLLSKGLQIDFNLETNFVTLPQS